MRWVFAAIVALHGLIHLLGVAKAFGWAELPQLNLPISRPMGAVWLAAALLCLAAAGALFLWPRGWWMLGAAAVVVSQIAIVASWQDARFGTVVNVLLLLGVLQGYLVHGPQSFEARFARDTAALVETPADPGQVTQPEIDALPAPVRRYLSLSGVVAGSPRASSYALRLRGRIRSGPDEAWMPFEAEQQSATAPAARFFLMRASTHGLPVEAYHRLVGGHATMQVRVLGVIPVQDASGEVMDRSESVTLLNDMTLLAPRTLLDPAITWEPIDDVTARARLSQGAQQVSATLHFDAAGRVVNFVSDDRSRATSAPGDFTLTRFSTPVTAYFDDGPPLRVKHAEARWHAPEGEFVYAEFDVLSATIR
ncbi:MAG: DUF6544 family protein [Myxococcota bacterium]